MKKWNWVLLTVIGIFLVVLATQQLTKDTNNQDIKPAAGQNVSQDPTKVGPAIGVKAPDFSLKGLDGKTYALSDLAGDKPVLINFWASWCPPCKAEAPDLARLYKKYSDQMEIYGVNLTAADSAEGAQQFVDKYGFTFPVLLDDTGKVGKMYQAFTIPTSYFVDKNGYIQNKMIGVTSPDQLEKMFQKLINTK